MFRTHKDLGLRHETHTHRQGETVWQPLKGRGGSDGKAVPTGRLGFDVQVMSDPHKMDAGKD